MNSFRLMTAAILVPVLKITGFRFSKLYRHGETAFHRAVYATVNTVQANVWAGLV